MNFYLVTIDNAKIEEEMEKDGATYVKNTRKVDFGTGEKVLS